MIAHARTAEQLIELADRDWSDEGLDRRVAAGLSSPQHAADVKVELPSPRAVAVAPADIVFHDGIEIDLGNVTVHVRHVGGDHSAESSVMYVEPDGVLFLGDCMSPSPEGALTAESAFRLRDVILGFAAEHYVEGHHESVSSRSDMEDLVREDAASRGCSTRRSGNRRAGRGHRVLHSSVQGMPQPRVSG